MSSDFKFKFDQMQENKSDASEQNENSQRYQSAGYNRNLCLRWLDGRLRYFNYAYLVTCEYIPEDGVVQLEFTTHKVSIKGYNLEPLYFELFEQLCRIINCCDERYQQLDNDETTVIKIEIT